MSQKSNFWLDSGSIGLKQKLKPYRNSFTSFTEMLREMKSVYCKLGEMGEEVGDVKCGCN